MAEIPILLVVATLVGAFLNVIRGVSRSSDPFDYKLFTGSLITASLVAITAAQALDLATITGSVALIITGITTGFGADFAISKLKNKKLVPMIIAPFISKKESKINYYLISNFVGFFNYYSLRFYCKHFLYVFRFF